MQSLTLIGAELLVLVVVGFFVRRQLLPVPCYPSTCYAFRFSIPRSARQFARSARKCQLSRNLATFLSANRAGP